MRTIQVPAIRSILIYLSLTLLLIVADFFCYSVTVPVQIDELPQGTFLHVGSQTLSLGRSGTLTTLQFGTRNPLIHEYQLDGTDYTNNYTLDTEYLQQISSSPLYSLYSGMRDLDGLSRWRNLNIWSDQTTNRVETLSDQMSFLLPRAMPLHISLQLQRPEISTALILLTEEGDRITITINRNGRIILVTRDAPGKETETITAAFFPVDPAPFAAMVLSMLIRITLWAELLLLFVLLLETILEVSRLAWSSRGLSFYRGRQAMTSFVAMLGRWTQAIRARLHALFQPLTNALHPVALVALVISCFFVSWIAAVQYHGAPHIFDAGAYFFAAKMYAQGHLWLPIPPAVRHFPGPFMIQHNGRWFTQYAPGTSLTLVPGIWLGVPWLVEPILGTLALLGIGLIAARLYDRRVATLAVLLGTLSPFYSYLAASYLSHAIALFYLVWGLWALLRFAQGAPWWNVPCASLLFGMAGLTRDVSMLFVALILPGILLLCWKQIRQSWRRWLAPGGIALLIASIFVILNLDFNLLLTGKATEAPRLLFMAGDHWGFGTNVGFYGQHTLASGLVNLDELLTILSIDLFGWPFYCTLAFLLMPFFTRRAVLCDWFALACILVLTGIWVGYYYHGIYLGPRYLFEALPFLLVLTARGILTTFMTAIDWVAWLRKRYTPSTNGELRPVRVSIITVTLLILLVAYNLGYFLPRQITLHTDFTGLPAGARLDLKAVYHPSLHHAIVITSDYTIYQTVLFPLNDPSLQNDVLYAFTGAYDDIADLRAAYPGRALYRLEIAPDGSVSYTPLPFP